MANSNRTRLSAAGAALVTLGALVGLLGCGSLPPADAPPAAAPAGDAPPAAAPSSGCAKDNDCKGERVCEKGQCMAPR